MGQESSEFSLSRAAGVRDLDDQMAWLLKAFAIKTNP